MSYKKSVLDSKYSRNR